MSCHTKKGYKATYYRDMGYGVNMEIYVVFEAIYGISGYYLSLFQKLWIYQQYGCVNEEMMINHQNLRRALFSDKPAHVGSMDMFHGCFNIFGI